MPLQQDGIAGANLCLRIFTVDNVRDDALAHRGVGGHSLGHIDRPDAGSCPKIEYSQVFRVAIERRGMQILMASDLEESVVDVHAILFCLFGRGS